MDTSKVLLNNSQIRNYLLLHEYVSMGILQEFGVKVPKFKVASKTSEVKEAASSGGTLFI
jgi:succinyl-CoA synthetase beta subunit